MPERVVDRLEQIEVEDEDRVSGAGAVVALERFIGLFAKQHAVGEIRQRVVPRHSGDARLAALAFGDVVVGRHPAAADHRLRGHRDGATVGERNGGVDVLPVRQPGT